MFLYGKLAVFAGGVLFGTAGIRTLTSKDAKKMYTHVTAGVLRAGECAMVTATKVRESASDILADAQAINEQRAEEDVVIEDMTEETV